MRLLVHLVSSRFRFLSFFIQPKKIRFLFPFFYFLLLSLFKLLAWDWVTDPLFTAAHAHAPASSPPHRAYTRTGRALSSSSAVQPTLGHPRRLAKAKTYDSNEELPIFLSRQALRLTCPSHSTLLNELN